MLNTTKDAAQPITLDGANGAKVKTKVCDWLRKDGVIVDETQLDAQNMGNASLVADKITTIS